MPAREHGGLPAWETADLPEPLPFSFKNTIRTIGPGAIMLAGCIGGGEWIAGPLTRVNYGASILWIATVAIVLQSLFNVEAVRYTLYTGEPIITGFMRLRPGSKFWGIVYTVLAVAQGGAPAIAATCSAVLFASFMGELASDSDDNVLFLITLGLVLLTTAVLVSGRTIERLLERLAWVMVVLIFGFLFCVNILFVPFEMWVETSVGFFQFGSLPEEMDIVLIALFAATAGSGGTGNLAISNWFRDKGFGMGGRVGAIGGALRGDGVTLAGVGKVFPTNETNLRRWRSWWKYTLVDQHLLWGVGALVGMYLNVNLAGAIIPEGTKLPAVEAGAFQAEYLGRMWRGLWFLTLLNGFWILFSTHVSNVDILVRTLTDICWAVSPRARKRRVSTIYGILLGFFTLWALFAASWTTALGLFKIMGIVASPILAMGALQILRVNTKLLPPELRPSWWRRGGLLLCALFYGVFAVALVRKALGI